MFCAVNYESKQGQIHLKFVSFNSIQIYSNFIKSFTYTLLKIKIAHQKFYFNLNVLKHLITLL